MKRIQLIPIDTTNILTAFDLELTDTQKVYVSHPMRSLALGYAYRDRCAPFGVYDGETMVGYAMVIYDHQEKAYTLWHFMIDKNLQGRGYGKAALRAVLDYISTGPFGDANRVLLTCNPDNAGALKLYSAAGFEATGRTSGIEIELELYL